MSKHIAFKLEQAYGHIVPSAGIALELVRRGYRVSYVVTSEFAPAIARLGAQPLVLHLPLTRERLLSAIETGNSESLNEVIRFRTDCVLTQMAQLYSENKPHLIIRDDIEDKAAVALALQWEIPTIQFLPGVTEIPKAIENDVCMLVPGPKILLRGGDSVAPHARIIGFDAPSRKLFFTPWVFSENGRRTILISVTTGLIPQIEFCKLLVEAFMDFPFNIVLSIGGLDRNSAVDKRLLGALPENFRVNESSSNLEILERACLYIGQGGHGSTSEAIYSGVPQILIPPSQYQESIASRVDELGLGTRLDPARVSAAQIRELSIRVLDDESTLRRVHLARDAMLLEPGADYAADAIEQYLR